MSVRTAKMGSMDKSVASIGWSPVSRVVFISAFWGWFVT